MRALWERGEHGSVGAWIIKAQCESVESMGMGMADWIESAFSTACGWAEVYVLEVLRFFVALGEMSRNGLGGLWVE